MQNGEFLSRNSTISFTNKPLSVNSTINRSVISIGEILNINQSELEDLN